MILCISKIRVDFDIAEIDENEPDGTLTFALLNSLAEIRQALVKAGVSSNDDLKNKITAGWSKETLEGLGVSFEI